MCLRSTGQDGKSLSDEVGRTDWMAYHGWNCLHSDFRSDAKMKWEEFVPMEDEEELNRLRTELLLLEDMDPFDPVKPIKGVEPRKCLKCRKSLPFIAAETSKVCPGECDVRN